MNSNHNLDVLIVGGGISGLATAWWLANQGVKVQVWEKADRAGGKIKTDFEDGFLTEQSASMVMNFKPEVDQFLSQLGMDKLKAQQLLQANSKRYLINKGKLQSLPMTITSLFFSPLWSNAGKFRLLIEPFILTSTNDNETVSEFVGRRFGKEFLEKAMEPFIAGTLASDPDLACARHVIPRLTALEKKFGSITAGIFAHKIMGKRTARNPEAFSFTGGMQSLVTALSSRSELNFKANTQVNKIIKHNDYDWEVQAHNGLGEVSCRTRHIVMASPANSSATIVQPLNQPLSDLLNSIEYASLSVVHLGLQRSAIKHPLDSVGFLVPRIQRQQTKLRINGNLWMSSVFANRAPDHSVLLSSYLGGARDPSAIALSEQDSIDKVIEDISSLLGYSLKSNPVMAKVNKHKYALPLYHGNYHYKLQAIDEQLQSMKGLHLQANYKGGISIRDRIVQAKQTSECIVSHLALSNNDLNLGQSAIDTSILVQAL